MLLVAPFTQGGLDERSFIGDDRARADDGPGQLRHHCADVFATGVLARAFRAAIADGQYSDGYHTTPWLPVRALWLRSGGVLQRAIRCIRRACPLPLPGTASQMPVCARCGAVARALLHRGCAC